MPRHKKKNPNQAKNLHETAKKKRERRETDPQLSESEPQPRWSLMAHRPVRPIIYFALRFHDPQHTRVNWKEPEPQVSGLGPRTMPPRVIKLCDLRIQPVPLPPSVHAHPVTYLYTRIYSPCTLHVRACSSQRPPFSLSLARALCFFSLPRCFFSNARSFSVTFFQFAFRPFTFVIKRACPRGCFFSLQFGRRYICALGCSFSRCGIEWFGASGGIIGSDGFCDEGMFFYGFDSVFVLFLGTTVTKRLIFSSSRKWKPLRTVTYCCIKFSVLQRISMWSTLWVDHTAVWPYVIIYRKWNAFLLSTVCMRMHACT